MMAVDIRTVEEEEEEEEAWRWYCGEGLETEASGVSRFQGLEETSMAQQSSILVHTSHTDWTS